MSRLGVTGAYFGETITHPGVVGGVEFYAWENRWYKLIPASNVGFYLHPHSHGAAFVDLELGHRVTTRFGLYFDLFTGLGYLHSWPYGDIYRRNEAGAVERKPNLGHPKLMVDGALGLGWDFSKNDLLPISAFARVVMFGEYPFNTRVALHGALMAGVTWRLGQLRKAAK